MVTLCGMMQESRAYHHGLAAEVTRTDRTRTSWKRAHRTGTKKGNGDAVSETIETRRPFHDNKGIPPQQNTE